MGKKIFFLLPSNVAGGAERVMISLANEMAKFNDISIIFLDSDSEFYEISESIKKIHLNCFNKSHSKIKKVIDIYRCNKKFNKYLEMIEPDVVISFLFITNMVCILSCKKKGIPIIISERNDPLYYGTKQKKIMKILYKYANGCVCQSKKVEKYMEEYYNINNAIVIENPISDIQFGEYIENKTNKIIAVGRLVKQKNHRLLINAFSNISEDYPNYSLYIYGEGNLRTELEQLIDAKKMNGKIILCGIQKEVIKTNRDAQLFILPSYFEGYPNTLVEAMANGIPVIASDVNSGTVAELIKNEENGYIFGVDNQEMLEMYIRKALSDINRINDFAKKNLYIKESLSINNIVNKWDCYINNVVK